jgi:hypothetical protein
LVLIRGDWQKESQFSPTTLDFWFWLKGIDERNLSLAQPHRILVLVKGDWRKESQFSPTTQDFFVLVKRDWRKESQFSPTTHEFWLWLEGIGEKNLSLS